jgi:ParB family chromosome partitioning protein
MPDVIQLIPLHAIDETTLPRDRTGLDPDALLELRLSIAASGLRMPVELFPHPHDPDRYGLLSGFRRLHAFRDLLELTGQEKYAAIPALLRPAAALATQLAAVIEENEIRADLSAYERGRIAWSAVRMSLFPTIEEAVEKLYPNANRDKRRQLRALAHLAEELDGELTHPEAFSLRQCLRLAAAVSRGYADLIRHALGESRLTTAEAQWLVLLPILTEAEKSEPDPVAVSRGGRPRRTLTPRRGLNIRRERTSQGWALHFTGREATSALLDVVFDEIELMFSRG